MLAYPDFDDHILCEQCGWFDDITICDSQVRTSWVDAQLETRWVTKCPKCGGVLCEEVL